MPADHPVHPLHPPPSSSSLALSHHHHHHHPLPPLPRTHNPTLTVVAPRSSSLPLAHMGSSPSKPATPTTSVPPSPSPAKPFLKRAFPRRKKSEDAGSLFSHQQRVTTTDSAPSPPKVSPLSPPIQPHRGAKQQLSQLASNVFSAGMRAAAGAIKPTASSIPAATSPAAFATTTTTAPLPPLPGAPASPSALSSSSSPAPPPPPPPPKSDSDPSSHLVPRPHPHPSAASLQINRSSIIPLSPGIESALNYMTLSDQLQQQQQPAPLPSTLAKHPVAVPPPRSDDDGRSVIPPIAPTALKNGYHHDQGSNHQGDDELKRAERPRARSESESAAAATARDDKRKSDSTISHCTIRPGAGGPRSSRPVSMAESFQSTYTIVPGNGNAGVVTINQRLSVVELLEEDDKSLDEGEDRQDSIVHIQGTSPSSLLQKRRSRSLTVAPPSSKTQPIPHPPASASATELKHPSYSEGFYSHPTASSNLIATSASYSPSNTSSAASPTHAMGRLQPVRNQTLPQNPSSMATTTFTYPTQRPLPNHPAPPPSFRQTAVSITNSLAPAAGLARKAVEKVRGALGHMGGSGSVSSTSISSISGYSSSTSVGSSAPSSFPNDWGFGLARTPSNQSSGTHSSSMHAVNIKEIKERERDRERQRHGVGKKEKGRTRRTPNASSGTHSVASISTTSGSDSDAFMVSTGPILGVLLRGPVRNRSGAPVAGGVLFGKELSRCVRETAVWVGKEHVQAGPLKDARPELKVYEERMLPAIVVRCAQHLLIWGVQEEGLFRVPGRAAHVAKLRSEFDTGVDYDMSECTPGDLDPHAVASIFKAYLRELPENILTQKLSPYFDIAIEQESSSVAATTNTTAAAGGVPDVNPRSSHIGVRKAIGLPIGQKPNSNPPPSSSSSATSASLPNIRKPPSLSTLAMPSFSGMRPPSKNLLLALRSLIGKLPRENKDLLRTVVELIKATATECRATKMPLSNLLMVFLPSLNVSAQLLRIFCEEECLWAASGDEVLDLRRDTVVLDIRREASEESVDAGTEAEEENANGQRRWTVVDRPEVPTVYLDSRSQASSASVVSSSHASTCASASISRDASTASSSLLRDDASVSSDGHLLGEGDAMLSSSADSSVLTPPTSSGKPSLSHLPLSLDTAKADEASLESKVVEATRSEVGVLPRKELSPLPSKDKASGEDKKALSSHLELTATEKQASLSPKRKSIPTLSFPSLSILTAGHQEQEPTSPADSGFKGLRVKKPSLRLLFSKKSSGSLNGSEPATTPGSAKSFTTGLLAPPSPLTPYSSTGGKTSFMLTMPAGNSSDSSVSTPRSTVTAPQTGSGMGVGVGVVELPPVLDTPVDEGGVSLRIELGLDVSPPATAKSPEMAGFRTKTEKRVERVKTMVGQTPISDWYRHGGKVDGTSAASSLADLISLRDEDEDEDVIESRDARSGVMRRPVPGRRRGASVSSSTSTNLLGMEDEELGAEEDWTKSVLLAAEMELEG